eukprot:UN29668
MNWEEFIKCPNNKSQICKSCNHYFSTDKLEGLCTDCFPGTNFLDPLFEEISQDFPSTVIRLIIKYTRSIMNEALWFCESQRNRQIFYDTLPKGKIQAKRREQLADMITRVPPATLLGFCFSRRIYLTSDQAMELLDTSFSVTHDQCPERVNK